MSIHPCLQNCGGICKCAKCHSLCPISLTSLCFFSLIFPYPSPSQSSLLLLSLASSSSFHPSLSIFPVSIPLISLSLSLLVYPSIYPSIHPSLYLSLSLSLFFSLFHFLAHEHKLRFITSTPGIGSQYGPPASL